ncbi:hypothetical protein LTS18_009808 [Coniosporium uncinatum]|uniref:Uncharacterized protein n=1 Tax=Coniosporium uncinatum TaxID=93489 RepID=A0ACC3D0G5_9PEZI|nr:hypothetical protein LTS18_009808 [Coniosporium uncinatum]
MAIGVAIIGSGIFVREEHLPAVLSTPTLSLKAIYSRSIKSAKAVTESTPNIDLYSDDAGSKQSYEDLLARSDIHAVIIALPILTQPDFIKKALSAGKHVLAEKPIAKDVGTATDLLSWYKSNVDTSKISFSVAENFRFHPQFLHAASKVKDLGKILGFRTRMHTLVSGGKYFETAWRKTPEYQGGFLLDGGVHFIAATRLLLQAGKDENKVQRVAAFTAQLQEHLPPVDTVDATWRLGSGVTGSFSVSFGTTFKGVEYSVACEKGVVTAFVEFVPGGGKPKGMVVVKNAKNEEVSRREVPDSSGVKEEVKAWAEGIEKGVMDGRQSAEEGLRDLEILEAMIQSGEQDGTSVPLQLQ